MRKLFITLLTWTLAAFSASPGGDSVVAELQHQLTRATSQADSLRILYDIFDAGTISERKTSVYDILHLSQRMGDHETELDMLRNLANIGTTTRNPELIDEALELITALPDSEDKRQTVVFLHACRASAYTFASTEERDDNTRKLLRLVEEMPEDIDLYEKVSRLFCLVAILGGQTQGELLSQYLDELDFALKALPQLQNNYLRSKFNSVAAISYWRNDENTKSVRADRNQLLNIKRLEQLYEQKNRKYKNFDVTRYVCLRRIARNHSALTNDEFNEVIAQINEIAARNQDVSRDVNKNVAMRVAVLLREKNYDEALPLAKQLADSAKTLYEQRFYTRQLIEVAEKAGNRQARQEAESRNSRLLEEFVNYKTGERVRELQLLYDVNALRRQQITEKLEASRQRNLWLLTTLGVFLVVALLLGILFLKERRRNRSMTRQISEGQTQQANDRKQLKTIEAQLDDARRREAEKVQLMTYIAHELNTPLSAIANYSQMIVDAVPGEELKDYIRNFVDIIDANNKLVQTVTADIHDFALNESKPMVADTVPVEINKLAAIAVESIEPRLDPGISITMRPAEGNPIIHTDVRRLQLLLLAAIDAMVRSLKAGKIILTVSKTDKSARFTVAAPGATPGKSPLKEPGYNSNMGALNASFSTNPEVPSLTLVLKF